MIQALTKRLCLAGAALAMLAGCNAAPSQADYDMTRGGRLDFFFNEPGTRPENLWEPDAEDVLVDMIEMAEAELDIAVMGFGRQRVIDAVIRAYDRGVKVRFVGDAGHLYNSGYQQLEDRQVPMVVGNNAHIMHDKFFVIDRRFVFCGTANITDTDLRRNSNNFVVIDSPPVAADFTAEFEQMFEGVFGHNKVEYFNGRSYTVDDTEVEVWFSPNEDAMGRILEYVDAAEESVRFTIFAFTKDQVGSAFIRKQEEFEEKNAADGIADQAFDPFNNNTRRSVAGVIDQSQLHSNRQYHEVFRLLGAGVPVRMDGNDNGRLPGDYQAGGGRLHSKTMVIDAYGANPVVITGSFNWSSSATVSNDEFLLVLKGERVARMYDEYFQLLWGQGRTAGGERVSEGEVAPGDLVINEVQWYGVHENNLDGTDEFIELRNLTDREINLDLWQIANPDDFIVGLPPGARIGPQSTYLILDHVLEEYQDGVPQDQPSAYRNGDLVLNSFNDDRQSRLYLKDGALELILKDPEGAEIDRAGDGGPAFVGGPENGFVYSMERNANPGDGTLESSWHRSSVTDSPNVNTWAQPWVVASPGEANGN
ncbi:MAG: hypothetical protein EP330_28660 [Deltaproteobacteria bacterium]|nr:MAG: hypothetical protein EP330_28660 [Deltaproteobacteria bacterium]